MTINITHTANLVALLAAKGYAIHKGDGFNSGTFEAELPKPTGEEGEYNTDIDGFWFTWQAPRMAEPEVGDTVRSSAEAWGEALRHFVENADIPLDTGESDEDDEALDIKLGIPLLQRCERFIAGYEDGGLQPDGLALLTAVRKVIAPLADEEAMCAELDSWCKANGLPYESADELRVCGTLSVEQDVWLADYLQRWDSMQASQSFAEWSPVGYASAVQRAVARAPRMPRQPIADDPEFYF